MQSIRYANPGNLASKKGMVNFALTKNKGRPKMTPKLSSRRNNQSYTGGNSSLSSLLTSVSEINSKVFLGADN